MVGSKCCDFKNCEVSNVNAPDSVIALSASVWLTRPLPLCTHINLFVIYLSPNIVASNDTNVHNGTSFLRSHQFQLSVSPPNIAISITTNANNKTSQGQWIMGAMSVLVSHMSNFFQSQNRRLQIKPLDIKPRHCRVGPYG